MTLPNKKKRFLLAVVAGILLFLAWPPLPFFPLVFIGFVPLLWMEKQISEVNIPGKGLAFFWFNYFFFLIWNGSTTWWVWNSSEAGSIFAITINSLFMTVPMELFRQTKERCGNRLGYFSFLFFWIGFEYLHMEWEFTWPWLTLGNAVAMFPSVFQFYEWTGHVGGSAWILAANLALFKWIFPGKELSVGIFSQRFNLLNRPAILAPIVLLLPMLISLIMYFSFQEKGLPVEVVVVQPNIDPYNEKYDFKTLDNQLNILLGYSDSLKTDATRFFVWPETAIPGSVWLHEPFRNQWMDSIRRYLENNPEITVVAGVSGYQRYPDGVKGSSTARTYRNGDCCYDAYNSAIALAADKDEPEFYQKSKLVPGVERMPYPAVFGFLEQFALDLGGIVGSLGIQEKRSVFTNKEGHRIAPVICYESVFGDYCTEYIRLGAQAIFIVTNDGWWGKTPGYKQHLYYASLRAVETRRPIARSANTGTSCFINQRGDISQPTLWWKPAAIRQTILFNEKLTLFSRYGDVTGRTAALLSIITIFYLLMLRFTKRKIL